MNNYQRARPCEHHYCRCIRANELAEMGCLVEALNVHWEKVRCRLPDSPPRAPVICHKIRYTHKFSSLPRRAKS